MRVAVKSRDSEIPPTEGMVHGAFGENGEEGVFDRVFPQKNLASRE